MDKTNQIPTRALLGLSPLLRLDEVDEEEWSALRADFENTGKRHMVPLIEQIVPTARQSKEELVEAHGKQLGSEKNDEIKAQLLDVLRALAYALRCSRQDKVIVNDTFTKDFHRGLQNLAHPLQSRLRNALFQCLDITLNMRLFFMALMNPVVIRVMTDCVPDAVENGEKSLEILRRVLFDAFILERVGRCDESEEFAQALLPYVQMSRDLDHDGLFEAIIPPLGGKLSGWKRASENNYELQLSEALTHKIRQDSAIWIDVSVPQVLLLEVSPETSTISFADKSFVTAKVARGKIHIGSLQKLRARTKEEIAQSTEKKSLECSVRLGWGMNWALTMLGASGQTFYLAHSTLWWYFKTIHQNNTQNNTEEDQEAEPDP